MKKNVVRLKNKVKRLVLKVFNTIRYLLSGKNERLVVNSWATMFWGEPHHDNLGDELIFYMLKMATSYKLYNRLDIYSFTAINYGCIGSWVDMGLFNSHTVIWGAGAIAGTAKLHYKPLKVCAVRGKLTRKYLLEQGVDCPEIYGDPALLLPKIYQPKVEKQYKLGIIPHYVDQENPLLGELSKLYGGNVCIIKMRDYGDWKDVVDNINRCEQVISSSLHGIIIADAYNIPNVWADFSDRVWGDGFKFRDYFTSVDRKTESSLRIHSAISEKDIETSMVLWKPISIDLRKLVESCPFDISLKARL